MSDKASSSQEDWSYSKNQLPVLRKTRFHRQEGGHCEQVQGDAEQVDDGGPA